MGLSPRALTASPLAKFPVGTVEVKSAWRVVLPDEDTSGVYTTSAEIELLKTDPRGHVVADPSNTVSQKVALEMLGVGPCYHMVNVLGDLDLVAPWRQALDGNPDWDQIFDGFDSTIDWPANNIIL